MNLSTQSIMIIVGVFAVGFLMMIPFAVMQSKRKKKAAQFSQQNSDQAVLHIYATSPVINDVQIKNMDFIRGENLQYTVALHAGSHHISAIYECTSVGVGGNINYKTPKPVECDITLEAGHEYSLSIYFYSPEQRYNYYNGDVGEAVYSQALDITGAGLGAYTSAYIICYKEK